MNVLDLFAGPGGWDIAARSLGMDPLGIEWDDAACATREAAGLRTLQGDIAALDPIAVLREHFAPRTALRVNGENGKGGNVPRPLTEPAPTLTTHGRESWLVEPVALDGLIASPPCQAWSMAGKRGGERDKEHVYEAARDLAAGHRTLDVERFMCEDPRSLLVVEPLRWALALRPTWIALEQVPPVLEFWRFIADVLRPLGYSVWTGILSAERYGVPQTRRRAILMAHRERTVHPPRATHQEYVPGEPAREEWTLEGHLLPWVSMAEALGWGMTARPYPVIASGRSTGGPDKEKVGGSHARQTIYDEQEAGRWSAHAGSSTPAAPAVDGKGRWHLERPATAVCGDPRISPPGYRGRADDYDAEGNYNGERSMDNAVRVTLEEAATLQGFPPDYPWQGSRTKQFEQVGNAIPPPLALAILGALNATQAD